MGSVYGIIKLQYKHKLWGFSDLFAFEATLTFVWISSSPNRGAAVFVLNIKAFEFSSLKVKKRFEFDMRNLFQV